MSLRHLSRHPQEHPPHLNGSSVMSSTPNGTSHPSAMVVSPVTISTAVPNNVPSSSQAPILSKLSAANEQTWLLIGRVAEQMGDLDHALSAYENALRHNPMSLSGLTQVAGIARIRENYTKAIEYFQQVISLQEENGEVWSALGHCYLMQDDLQKAYAAYQQALYLLPNPKEDPKLWYGIGILYDRYGSLDHAEEAFASVLRMDKDLDFDKANEILFRLGIIYKQQGKYEESLACFDRILRNPPSPLAHADIWFQIGHVYEQQKDHTRAKHAYEKVIADNPNHAKVLQQLGWLYHQDGSDFQNQELAIQHLTKSLECDPSDAQSWYLLGRAYMAGQKYNKAYEAYQQAVYRDGRNPTFWCSIGVLYFQINQFRDALDAYSRAIRINPYISEVWFDLGSLYESCNNQISDAIDAYARASELDPTNQQITQRLQLLRNAQATGGQVPAAPGPQDVHPTAYASAAVPPSGLNGPPPFLLQSGSHRPSFRDDSRGPAEIALPPPSQVGNGRASPPPPFKGGPPPPVVIDEARHHPSHPQLAPMDVDRPLHARDGPIHPRGSDRGPASHQNLLLHPSQPQGTPDDLRNGAHPHHADPYYSRSGRPPSRSVSPLGHGRPRSPQSVYYSHSARQPTGPAQPSAVPSQRSPRAYPHEMNRIDQEMAWDRRGPPPDHRDWEREREGRRPRYSGEYPPHPQSAPLYPPRSPSANPHRPHSPPGPSPRSSHQPRYWDSKPPSAGPSHAVPPAHPVQHRPVSPQVTHHDLHRRYDPRYDVRDQRDYEVDQRNEQRGYAGSPEGLRHPMRNPPQHMVGGPDRESESPHATPTMVDRRRRPGKEKDLEPLPPAQQTLPSAPTMLTQEQKQQPRRRRAGGKRKEDGAGADAPKFGSDRGLPTNKPILYSKSASSPEPLSSASSRSVQPSPTSATPRPPSRTVYDDYDADSSTVATDALMSLSAYRAPESSAPISDGPTHSPTISSGSRHSDPSPRPPPSHRGSVSSTRSHTSPGSQAASLKRALSPGPDENGDNKRSRMEVKRRVSSPSGRRTPVPSTRPSPIPFRTQPASHSPEARQAIDVPYAPSPPALPSVLPPHPRPIGSGLSAHLPPHSNGTSSIALPPIATLSPTPTPPSPNPVTDRDRDDQMQVDGRSTSPPSHSKFSEVIHSTSRSPPTKQSSSPRSEKKESL